MAKQENDVLITEERIKIYAVNAKHKEKPFLATGITDAVSKKILTGQENMTPEELKKEGFIINPMDNYMIRNNDELVLQKKGDVYIKNKDLAMYNFYLIQPNIAPSKSAVIRGTHDFYMQNFEAEAANKISLSKSKAKASAKILDMNLTDMVNMLFFFGGNGSSLTTDRKSVV